MFGNSPGHPPRCQCSDCAPAEYAINLERPASPPQPHQPQVAELLKQAKRSAQTFEQWIEAEQPSVYSGIGHDASENMEQAFDAGMESLASALRAKPATDFSELEAVVREMRADGDVSGGYIDSIENFIRSRK